jgi:bidirectional [NiFe] hydrogenase diaphorase subunit
MDERLRTLDARMEAVDRRQDELIEILHLAQDQFGYLPPEVLEHIAERLELPPSMVVGVATFYHLFRSKPAGDHQCIVCTGTACFVKGAEAIVAAVAEELGMAPGSLDAERSLSFETVRCPATCGLAPVVVMDGEIMAHQDPDSVIVTLRRLLTGEV